MGRRTLVQASVGLLLLLAAAASELSAIGCGGLLNLIPQAQVVIRDREGRERTEPYQVFVHPMEGSLVLLRNGSDMALGLDKNKRHAVEVAVKDLKLSADGSILDVPEHLEYKVLTAVPHFDRTYASLAVGAGETLIVRVKR
jgi:hypothetical protein